jgi:surface protein
MSVAAIVDGSSYDTTTGTYGIRAVLDKYLYQPNNAIFNDTTKSPYFGPIEGWNVSAVEDFSDSFENGRTNSQHGAGTDNSPGGSGGFVASGVNDTTTFNKNLSAWNTASATDMSNMFNGCSTFNTSLATNNTNNWNVSSVKNMAGMFQGAAAFNQPIGNWTTSDLINLNNTFKDAVQFNQNIGNGSNWITTKVTNMAGTFSRTTDSSDAAYVAATSAFNQDISTWHTSNVVDMSNMFHGATGFNRTINTNSVSSYWVTSKVITMASMFEGAVIFNKTCEQWDTTNVTTMENMFKGARVYNQRMNIWHVTNVITFEGMFQSEGGGGATDVMDFNQDISSWTLKTSSFPAGTAVTLKNMFNGCQSFNQPIGSWDVSRVTDMDSMFETCIRFNKQLGSWNTTNVTTMANMFKTAAIFNQDISDWKTTSVSNMNAMFSDAGQFNSDIGRWDVSSVTDMGSMFNGATTFNQNIRSWDTTGITEALTNMFLGANSMEDNYGDTSVDGYGNDPTNADFFQQEFLELTWTSVPAGAVVSIPLSGATSLNEFVDVIRWSHGETQHGVPQYTLATDISTKLTFTNPAGAPATIKARITVNSASGGYTRLGGTWTNGSYLTGVVVTVPGGSLGGTTRWALGSPFGAATTNPKLTSLEQGFLNCSELIVVPEFSPDTVTNMTSTFQGCSKINDALNSWHTNNVSLMTSMFEDASRFDQPISGWHTSNVVDMSKMFKNAAAFDQTINYSSSSFLWNTSAVTSMSEMFSGATTFGTSNGVINLWLTTALKDASSMFEGAVKFNNEIGANSGAWVTSTVTDMNSMFKGATEFDNNASDLIGSWIVTAVTDMTSMFEDASDFNRDISAWQPSAVVGTGIGTEGNGMKAMFKGATSFDCGANATGITNWTVQNVKDMSEMFSNANAFNQTISGWTTINVTDMNNMFFSSGTPSFNQEISLWNVSNVTDMSSMFEGNTAFNNFLNSATNSGTNRDGLNGWDVSSLNKITKMFKGATAFNQWIGNWDVNTGGTTNFSEMFSGATAFNKDCGLWNMSKATNLSNMFNGATVFNQNIRIWDTRKVTNYAGMFNGASGMDTVYGSGGDNTAGFNNGTTGPTSAFFNQEQLVFTFTNNNGTGGVSIPLTGRTGTMDGDIDVIRWNEGEALTLGVAGDQNLTFTALASTTTFTARVTVLNSDSAGYTRLGGSYTTDNYLTDVAVEVDTTKLNSGTSGIQTTTAWSLGRNNSNNLPLLTSLEEGFKNQRTLTQVPEFLPVTVQNLSQSFFENDTTSNTSVFNGSGVQTWNTANVTNLSNTFRGAQSFNQDIGNWDTSSVTTMTQLFHITDVFNIDLSKWDVREVLDTTDAFKTAIAFNNGSNSRTNPISGRTGLNGWSPSKTINMEGMFSGANAFNRDLTNWETNALKDTRNMFKDCNLFNGTLNGWKMSKVTNMSEMFLSAVLFNQYIGDWDTINVETMDMMFQQAEDFNQDISKWNTSNVTDMSEMFNNAYEFNNGANTNVNVGSDGDTSSRSGLNGWNTSNVHTITNMFYGATTFNRYIGDWNVTAVDVGVDAEGTGFTNMFRVAQSFNQDIGLWNTKTVKKFTTMFSDAISMNQNISGWDVTSAVAAPTGNEFTNMFARSSGTSLMISNQGFTGVTPTSSEFGQEILSFTFESVPDGTTLTIPLSGAASIKSMRDVIRWNTGDQTLDTVNGDTTTYQRANKLVAATTITNNPSYTNDTGSTLTITARVMVQSGTFSRLGGTWSGGSYLGEVHCTRNSTDFKTETQAQDTTTWALKGVASFEGLFQGCSKLRVVPKFVPIASADGGVGTTITNMKNSFNGCSVFGSTGYVPDDVGDNNQLASWHTKHVNTTEGMFQDAAAFNQPISYNSAAASPADGYWNMDACTSMKNMFFGASVFNQDISTWLVDEVIDMSQMFRDAAAYNQILNTWDTSSLVTANGLFHGATVFDQDLSNWNTSLVVTMADMFHDASEFDKDISVTGIDSGGSLKWDTRNVKDMNEMFKGATKFSLVTAGCGEDWETSNVTDMSGMFEDAVGFNQDLGTKTVTTSGGAGYTAWNVAKVKTMTRMFKGATRFDQDLTTNNINAWNVGLVTDMSFMFNGAVKFSEPLYSWNTANVTDMTSMFEGATLFNEDVGLWDVKKVTTFASMFKNAPIFNKNIRIWETDSIVIPYITTMNQMFNGADQIIANYAGVTGFGTKANQRSPDVNFFNQERLVLTWTNIPFDGTNVTIPLSEPNSIHDNVDVIRWANGEQVTISSGLTYSLPTDIDGSTGIANTGTITALITVYSGSYGRLGGTWSNGTYLTSMSTNKDTNKPATKWALNGLTSLEKGFEGCDNLTTLPTFCPPTLDDLKETFKDCSTFNGVIVNWDTANVTDMTSCFENATVFNQGIGMWKTQNVTSMQFMFKNAKAFNQYIRNWVIVSLRPYPTAHQK